LKDKVLIRQTMSRDTTFHEIPHLHALRPIVKIVGSEGDPDGPRV
jgi:hypothetical protein